MAQLNDLLVLGNTNLLGKATMNSDLSAIGNVTVGNGLAVSGATTMNGNLTVGSSSIKTDGSIQGTQLKATSAGNISSNTGKIAVLDSGGQIYYRTPAQLKEDIGITSVTIVTYEEDD